VVADASGETVFPGYLVKEFGEVRVGFIGLTLEATPEIVSPEFVKGLSFKDEADTINAAVAELTADGVQSIVVLIHEGGYPAGDDINGCEGMSGPIVDIVERLDPAVDTVVTGHTHQAYICEVNGMLVSSGKSYGRLLTEIDLAIDPTTGDVVEKKAANLIVSTEGTSLPEIDTLIEKYDAIAAPLADKAIGSVTADITREAGESGDAPMGRLIADIQLDATRDNGAQIAFMNPGGVRNSLLVRPAGDEEEGVVTFAEAHSVQPFGNALITMTLTGQQLHDMLEEQWQEKKTRIMHPSKGFTYTWDSSGAVGDHVDPATMKLDGEPIVLDQTYRVTVNSFLANGGDGFTVLTKGTNRVGGPLDLEALVEYFEANSPISPDSTSRITRK
jgi:5'-nucleotidase